MSNDVNAVFLPANPINYFRDSMSVVLNTIVTPAANVNGILIYQLTQLGRRSVDVGRLMYKTSAPLAWNDNVAFTVAIISVNMNSSDSSNRGTPTFIPPGNGLYEQASGVLDPTFNTGLSLTYKLVD